MNIFKKLAYRQEWLYISANPALGRLRQEDCEFKDSLDYIVKPF
jgi:hypothetical protein